ncbi:MAG: DNA polymerase I [Syntrophobacteraceae bacterium]
MEPRKSFYIIDASSYIYRAFYALTRLTNSKGMPTQAVYGFAQMLLKVIRDRKPDYICVVFDAPGGNFRHQMFESYKATRQKMPEDLVVQLPYIRELVKVHGIPQMELQGYEADDLIATLTHWGLERELNVVIVSGDKDLHQLIRDPEVLQWDTQRDRVFDEAGVLERFGVTPRQMADYLALVGDSTDNVPGVKGVGEKTARELISRWGTLDGIYEHLDDIASASVRKKLAEGRDLARLSHDLVLFREDAPVGDRVEAFVPAPALKPELVALYDELDFKGLLESLRKEWGGFGEAVLPVGPAHVREDRIVTTPEDLAELVRGLEGVDRFSVDLETTSTDPMLAELVGVSLSWQDHRAWYIPVGHCGPNSGNQLPKTDVLRALQPFLSVRKPEKVGQNIKYEWVVFKRHGIDLQGIGFDTMVASYLLDPGAHAHGLDRIVAEHLGESKISYDDVTGRGKDRIGFAEVDVNRAACYSCEDAETTWRLAPVLSEKLCGEDLEDLYACLELPLIEILAGMEYRGILVDASRLATLSGDFEKALESEAAKIYDLAKEEFNIQSPKQLGAILFDKLGLRVVKKTKSGPSTDVSVLEELALEHPIAEHILVYRTLSKLKGTYADALPRLIHPVTGRIHTSFNQTVTATGRLSSSDPNLQNIPIRTEEGRKIREAFTPAPGCVLLSADYSQIELRILAHYSRDARLVEAFRQDEDVHRRTAAEMFGVHPAMVTSDMRRQAKTINFGIIYGMGAFGLAQRLRIPNKAAKTAIERYFVQYSGVKRFIDETIEEARRLGCSRTLLGRKRSMPELQSRNHTMRQLGERLAINTPIQGTAADLIKKAMIDVECALKKSGLKTAMLLQVHDELVFEVPEGELEAAKRLVREEMEGVWADLAVPLKIDLGVGNHWAAAHS